MKLDFLLFSLWIVITLTIVQYLFYQYLKDVINKKNKELQSLVTNIMLMHDDQEQIQADVTILKTDNQISFQKIQKELENLYKHLEISLIPEKKEKGKAKVIKENI